MICLQFRGSWIVGLLESGAYIGALAKQNLEAAHLAIEWMGEGITS